MIHHEHHQSVHKRTVMAQVRMKRIQRVYPLSEVPSAFEESAGGHVVGKLVIAVNSTASY